MMESVSCPWIFCWMRCEVVAEVEAGSPPPVFFLRKLNVEFSFYCRKVLYQVVDYHYKSLLSNKEKLSELLGFLPVGAVISVVNFWIWGWREYLTFLDFFVLALFSEHKLGARGVEKSTEKGILGFPFTPRTELTAQKRSKRQQLKKTNVRKYSSVNEEQNQKPYYFTV